MNVDRVATIAEVAGAELVLSGEQEGVVTFLAEEASSGRIVAGVMDMDPNASPRSVLVTVIDPSARFAADGGCGPFDGGVPGALRLVQAYLENLEGGRPQAAAACFHPDAVYSIPPPAGCAERVTVTGRSAIQEVFERRGLTSARHHIEQVAIDGDRCLVTGHVAGVPGGDIPFASALRLGPDVICEYVAMV